MDTEYTGREFDPSEWTVVEGRWDHEHCRLCFATICEEPGEGCFPEGFVAEGGSWICPECHAELA